MQEGLFHLKHWRTGPPTLELWRLYCYSCAARKTFIFSGARGMKLIAGNNNRPLAEAIAQNLGLQLTQASIRHFADMEVFVEILENVRGEDTFVIQPTSYPVNDSLMELLITIDTLRRASARRVTAVVPYYGYARQDR